jgi:hypothetical protein
LIIFLGNGSPDGADVGSLPFVPVSLLLLPLLTMAPARDVKCRSSNPSINTLQDPANENTMMVCYNIFPLFLWGNRYYYLGRGGKDKSETSVLFSHRHTRFFSEPSPLYVHPSNTHCRSPQCNRQSGSYLWLAGLLVWGVSGFLCISRDCAPSKKHRQDDLVGRGSRVEKGISGPFHRHLQRSTVHTSHTPKNEQTGRPWMFCIYRHFCKQLKTYPPYMPLRSLGSITIFVNTPLIVLLHPFHFAVIVNEYGASQPQQ